MTRNEFTLGCEFWCSNRKWRCTDVGRRVVVAICIDHASVVTVKEGVATTKELSYEEAVAYGWFDGPPYGVVEYVFDENDLEICSFDPDEEDGEDE